MHHPFRTMLAVATTVAVTLTAPASANAAGESLYLLGYKNLEVNQGEILDFLSAGGLYTLATTAGSGVRIFDMNDPKSITDRTFADFSAAFGDPANLADTSSVALDPLGRGFGVVSLIPTDNGGTVGKVGFYDYVTGAVLGSVDVGFHPDSLKFSADGTKLFVANEGEFTSGGDTDAPGSISVIDLSGATGVGNVVAAAGVATYDFQAANLGVGVNLDALRINDPTATELYRHVEPEFMTIRNGKVYVTLQENNAIAEFDPATGQWTKISPLGTITNTIDASDRDGPGNDPLYLVDDAVKGLPMPDSIASFTINGTTYLVTANEGDFRVDDFDRARVKDFDAPGGIGDVNSDGVVIDDSSDGLGRLRISTLDSDPDGDNVLEDIIMPGTRSFSIWNADTGALVKDSGGLEEFLHSFFPLLHNIELGDPGEFDQRSDDKGPEPEGLDLLQLADGSLLVAVGLERQNGILLARIFESAPDVLDIELINAVNNFDLGLISPESLLWVTGLNSPTGRPILLVGYEGDAEEGIAGGIGVYGVPEPTTALLAIAGTFALAARRRRRAA